MSMSSMVFRIGCESISAREHDITAVEKGGRVVSLLVRSRLKLEWYSFCIGTSIASVFACSKSLLILLHCMSSMSFDK